MSTPTDLTITTNGDRVVLQLHAGRTALHITAADASRIATDLDDELRSVGHASIHTIHMDEHHSLEVDTATARRLTIDLHTAAARIEPPTKKRKTAKERAFIDDSTALKRTRTRATATRIARKMINDGQDIDTVLDRLWRAGHSRGWDAGVSDATTRDD